MPDNTLDLSLMYDKIKAKYGQPSVGNTSLSSNPIQLPTDTSKIRFDSFSNDRPEYLYDTLNSGQKVARYENYLPGTDNNERLASQQGTGEKWANGLMKFGSKTLNAVVGGTVGSAYGVLEGISEGNLNAVYDNSFTNTLADIDTKLNYQLPNLYTQQETDKGLGGQLLTTNFWADKVLGGLSFTAGAIVSEGIWAWATGGTSLATSAARWSTKSAGLARIANGTSKFSRLLKNSISVGDDTLRLADNAVDVNRAVRFGQAGEALNTLRFTMTSAGYEASVEALQFKKEQEENFYRNFEQQNGRQPNTEEITSFQENLSSSANAVFGVNMALVGSSNLVTLGNVFNLKSPVKTGFGEMYNRALYGIGKTTPSRLQSINRRVLPFIQNAVTEGLYEEGGQSITSATAGKWLEHAYDTNNTKDSFDLAGALYENISHQYGSKEGWVENGVGIIIGLLGEAGTGNTRGGVNRQVQEFENRSKLNETYTSKALSEHFLMMNRINGFNKQSEDAQKRGNLTEARIAQDGVIFSLLNNRHQLGDSVADVTQDIQKALGTVTQEQLQEMGVETDLSTWRQEQVNSFSEVAKSFKKNRQFAEYIIGRNPIAGVQELDSENQLSTLGANNTQEALVQSLAFTMMGGQRSHTTMKEAVQEMGQILDYEKVKALDTISSLETVTAQKRNEVNIAVNRSNSLEEQRQRLVEEIRNVEETVEGDVSTGNKVLRLSDKLAKLTNLISENEINLQQLADEINLNNKTLEQTTGVTLNQGLDIQNISVEDLKNLDSNTKNLDKVLNAIRASNPENSARLEAILEEYNNARKTFGAYQSTVLAFRDGKVNIDNINTLLGRKVLKKNKNLDSATKEWLSEILGNYSEEAVRGLNEISQMSNRDTAISNESVIDKLRRGDTLTEEEQTFYNENKLEIDTFMKREPMLPVVPLPTAKTKLQYLRERLANLISRSNNALTFIGTSTDEFLLEKPTQAEVEQYQQSLQEGNPDLDLQEKLSNWKVLDSFINEENLTMADLAELIQQQQQNISEEETITEITGDDSYAMTQESQAGEKLDDYTLAQNVTGNATIKRNKDGSVTLHHISAESLVNIIGEPFQVTRKDKPIDISQIAIGDIVTTESGLVFSVENGNILKMRSEVFDNIPLLVVRSASTSWTYADLYYFNGSEYVKKPSDFFEDIQADEIYNLEQGAPIRFEIDRQDSYSKQLLDKYKKSPTEENRKALTEGIKIYLVSKGKRISTLKGERGASPDNFKLLREKAFELAIQDSYEVDLQVTSTVSAVFLGSPQFFISEEGQLESRPFTESSLGKVLTKGFVLNGEVTTSEDLPQINTSYVSKISKKYPQRKMPIVVVKRGENYVALPIFLNKTPLGQRGLDMVENAIETATSPIEVAKNLNALINQEGVRTEKILPQEVTDENLERIRTAFQEHLIFTTADEIASQDYSKENLLVDAQMYIDADNLDQVINAPKVRIDIQNMLFNQEVTFDTSDVKSSVENELDTLAKELYNDFIRNASTTYVNSRGDIIENSYTDAFDEESMLEGNSHLDKLHNIRILREAFKVDFSKNKILRDAIGNEKIERVRILFGILDNINKQVKPKEDILKSGNNNTKC